MGAKNGDKQTTNYPVLTGFCKIEEKRPQALANRINAQQIKS